MSQLSDFHTKWTANSNGITLSEIWQWTNFQLEYTHDYIQWMFPLLESSQVHPNSPTLTISDLHEIREDTVSKVEDVSVLRIEF